MNDLIELINDQQTAGEPRRRWFNSADVDLIVWYDKGDSLTGFEFYYDKSISEHAFIWRSDSGYIHLAVDDGEQKSMLNYKESPILVADGQFDVDRIRKLFEGSSKKLPAAIVSFVKQKIEQHPGCTHQA
jgi:hypothetical protein